MKKFLVIILCLLPFGAGAGDGSLSVSTSSAIADSPVKDCRCKGIPLHGRVRVVDGNADFTVRVVTSALADLSVRRVTSYPNECGEWQFVNDFSDFTVRFVDGSADFTIRYVDSYSGTR